MSKYNGEETRTFLYFRDFQSKIHYQSIKLSEAKGSKGHNSFLLRISWCWIHPVCGLGVLYTLHCDRMTWGGGLIPFDPQTVNIWIICGWKKLPTVTWDFKMIIFIQVKTKHRIKHQGLCKCLHKGLAYLPPGTLRGKGQPRAQTSSTASLQWTRRHPGQRQTTIHKHIHTTPQSTCFRTVEEPGGDPEGETRELHTRAGTPTWNFFKDLPKRAEAALTTTSTGEKLKKWARRCGRGHAGWHHRARPGLSSRTQHSARHQKQSNCLSSHSSQPAVNKDSLKPTDSEHITTTTAGDAEELLQALILWLVGWWCHQVSSTHTWTAADLSILYHFSFFAFS